VVRNAATNVSREATTNDAGYYKIVNLPPGEYVITVKANNYKTAVVPAVKLTIGQTVNQDCSFGNWRFNGDRSGDVDGASRWLKLPTPPSPSGRRSAAHRIICRFNERNYLSFALTTSTVSRD
jgi:hypothetical protein